MAAAETGFYITGGMVPDNTPSYVERQAHYGLCDALSRGYDLPGSDRIQVQPGRGPFLDVSADCGWIATGAWITTELQGSGVVEMVLGLMHQRCGGGKAWRHRRWECSRAGRTHGSLCIMAPFRRTCPCHV